MPVSRLESKGAAAIEGTKLEIEMLAAPTRRKEDRMIVISYGEDIQKCDKKAGQATVKK